MFAMCRPSVAALCLFTFSLFLSSPCSADLFRVTATGTITSVSDDAGLLDGSISVGSSFTYTWFYDTSAPAPPTDNPGFFSLANGIFGATVACGSYIFKPGFLQFSPGYPSPTQAYQKQQVYSSNLGNFVNTIGLTADDVVESSNLNAPLVYSSTQLEFYYNSNQALSLSVLPPLNVYNSINNGLNSIPSSSYGSLDVSILSQQHKNAGSSFDGNINSVYAEPVQPPNAVLLVHGIWGSANSWNGGAYGQVVIAASAGMVSELKVNHYTVAAVDFPTEPETSSNSAPIEDQAKALRRRIGDLLASSGEDEVDLVCHSMGGLAARYYLEHPELWQKDKSGNIYPGVYKFIMIGTPNLGVDTMFLNPVGTVARSHSLTLPHYEAHDTVNDFSTALKEMFSEWEPAPDADNELSNGKKTYSYPIGFRLTEWPSAKATWISPIPQATYYYADYWVPLITSYFGSTDKEAIADAENMFSPHIIRDRTNTQLDYYAMNAQKLGVDPYAITNDAYPIHGVNYRYVSPFLVNLNSTPDLSNVKYYIIAGTEPTAFDYKILKEQLQYVAPPGLPRVISSLVPATVPGPFEASLPNDGAVPIDSVFGRDPINHTELFPYLPSDDRVELYVDHHNEPNDPNVISQVLHWLGE